MNVFPILGISYFQIVSPQFVKLSCTFILSVVSSLTFPFATILLPKNLQLSTFFVS